MAATTLPVSAAPKLKPDPADGASVAKSIGEGQIYLMEGFAPWLRFACAPNGRIQFDLHLYGQRFRETPKRWRPQSPLNSANHTEKNERRNRACTVPFGTETIFPTVSEPYLRKRFSEQSTPIGFIPFLMTMPMPGLTVSKANGKAVIAPPCVILSTAIIPFFGNILVSEITLSQVDYFRPGFTCQK